MGWFWLGFFFFFCMNIVVVARFYAGCDGFPFCKQSSHTCMWVSIPAVKGHCNKGKLLRHTSATLTNFKCFWATVYKCISAYRDWVSQTDVASSTSNICNRITNSIYKLWNVSYLMLLHTITHGDIQTCTVNNRKYYSYTFTHINAVLWQC